MGSLPPTLSVPSPQVPSQGISLGFGTPRLTASARLENPYDKQTTSAILLRTGEGTTESADIEGQT